MAVIFGDQLFGAYSFIRRVHRPIIIGLVYPRQSNQRLEEQITTGRRHI